MTADPAARTDRTDRIWGALGHAGAAAVTFLAPLAVLLAKGSASPYVRAQAVEALNFQITVVIAYLGAALLSYLLIGLFLLPLIFVANIVLCVTAAMAVWHGAAYRYPLALRLVK